MQKEQIFVETVLFTGIFCSLKSTKPIYKTYLWGILVPGLTIILTSIRNIAVLGSAAGMVDYP